MPSLNTFSAFAQRARTLIIIAMLAIGLAGAPLAINALNIITTTQTPHIAAPHFSAPGATSPLADATPNLRCGGVASPC